ncbi:MAG: hypothetical protein BLITH_0506 [Brockia lithotrophica]|uniref:Uncharacterized protein n=1 Tax=Brockia lithotrophica TaxID=933949 RepID=A0A2T5G4G6_9BACL|nr:MAG: hypothetical protein BLITH_0506 [Brockia lithotrophica]
MRRQRIPFPDLRIRRLDPPPTTRPSAGTRTRPPSVREHPP